MEKQVYTLAMYRVKPGREEEFIREWKELAATFSVLPDPPLWGTLVRNNSDPTLFYSFGPWRSKEHVRSMRGNPNAGEAFARLHLLCDEMTPGDYEIVVHVDVAAGR